MNWKAITIVLIEKESGKNYGCFSSHLIIKIKGSSSKFIGIILFNDLGEIKKADSVIVQDLGLTAATSSCTSCRHLHQCYQK